MKTAALVTKRPICLFWSEVEKWTPNSSLLRFGKLPADWQLLSVREFATQLDNKERVEPEVEYQMAGIKWYGEGVFHRETVLGKEQSANNLYPLKPGTIIYNRLFAWKESFAVVPNEFQGLYVSNEFPQFEIDETIALPDYIYLVFNTKRVIRAVNSASVGSAVISRNRFKESDFLGFKIPLPPLPVQRKIIAHWKVAQRQRLAAEEALSRLIEELHVFLTKQTHGLDKAIHSSVFLTDYANTKQWDVKSGRAAAFRSANPAFVRLGDFTEECTETFRPWEKPKKEWPIYGVNNKDGVFLSAIQIGQKFNAAYKKIEKDWFFHNPTRANVGSLGIVPEVPDDAITSSEYQVWKLKNGFLPNFMALLLRTDYFLNLVAFNRVGGVKQRMYYANLAEIRIPIIPDDVQQAFAKRRQEIVDNISAANEMLARRKTEIEQMIFSTHPVEGH